MKAMTQQRVRQLFIYDPNSGIFRWRIDVRAGRNNALLKARAGDVAGFPSGYGYWAMSVDGVRTSGHRVAWLYVTGEMPKADIDHINGRRDDNRWSNLRLASRSVNMQNLKGPHKDSSTGYLGVERKRERYAARICIDGKKHSLGVFDTPAQAHEAYLSAKRRLHEGNAL